MGALTRPVKLREGHSVSGFDCGEEVLNLWLTKRALVAHADRTANTFVVCRGRRVVGFYSLCTGSLAHTACTSSLRRNAPDPVPAMILARLAVDLKEQGNGLGPDLLLDAELRVLRAAKNVGARTLVVHALNERRADFYKKYGFLPLPVPLALHKPLDKIASVYLSMRDRKR